MVVLEQRLQNSSATANLQLPLTAEERTVLRGVAEDETISS